MSRKSVSMPLVVAIGIFVAPIADAATYVGTISWLEIWRTGNVVFKLSPEVPDCNHQIVLNEDDDGTKDLYAALLTAKATGKAVKVYLGDCGPAQGYGGNYNLLDYLYVDDLG